VAAGRQIVWAKSAEEELDDILVYISQSSSEGVRRVLLLALSKAASLETLAERGRMVPELQDPHLRELLVYDYRMIYRVHSDRVVIEAFVHGARDFSRWRSEKGPDF
jgi:toxin ParE1/3/4